MEETCPTTLLDVIELLWFAVMMSYAVLLISCCSVEVVIPHLRLGSL
jgi:hypothetical protein